MKRQSGNTVHTAGPLLMDGVPVLKKETKLIAALLSIALSVAFAVSADATPRHKQQGQTIACDLRGCSDQVQRARAAQVEANAAVDANGGAVVDRRPQGCPRAFCGCEASLYLFGQIRPELNLASNWIRKFPRTSPAPGMAAARSGHVMVLMSHVEGNNWLVHDGNSGGGMTREHVRSIKGYVIVNPRGSYAENPSSGSSGVN